MSDLIKNLESAIENGNEKYGFVDMLLLVNCRNEISRLQGIINKALRQQPEPDTVRISKYQFEMSAQIAATASVEFEREPARTKAKELFDSLCELQESER
tara:strand:- start:61 stop:360 length:300 start_codon:yes stop_codon:yes gene_type:complete